MYFNIKSSTHQTYCVLRLARVTDITLNEQCRAKYKQLSIYKHLPLIHTTAGRDSRSGARQCKQCNRSLDFSSHCDNCAQYYVLFRFTVQNKCYCCLTLYMRSSTHKAYMKRVQEALRSAVVWDLCSAILFLEDINHTKSTGSPRLQRPLFYSLGTGVISRAAAIVYIIELLTLPDKMQRVRVASGCQ